MRVIYIILAVAGWVWTAVLAWIIYVKLHRAPQPIATAEPVAPELGKHDQ